MTKASPKPNNKKTPKLAFIVVIVLLLIGFFVLLNLGILKQSKPSIDPKTKAKIESKKTKAQKFIDEGNYDDSFVLLKDAKVIDINCCDNFAEVFIRNANSLESFSPEIALKLYKKAEFLNSELDSKTKNKILKLEKRLNN